MSVSALTANLRELVKARLNDQVETIEVADRHTARWWDTWQSNFAGQGIAALLYIEGASVSGRYILEVTIAVQVEENCAQNHSNAGTASDAFAWAEEIWAALDQWAPSEAWTAFDNPSISRVYDNIEQAGWVFTATTRTAYGLAADTE